MLIELKLDLNVVNSKNDARAEVFISEVVIDGVRFVRAEDVKQG